jgi:hypothetical protein
MNWLFLLPGFFDPLVILLAIMLIIGLVMSSFCWREADMARDEDELHRFVRDSLTRKIPRADIERALSQAGWGVDQVSNALAISSNPIRLSSCP